MTRSFKRHGERIRMELEEFEVRILRELRDGLRAQLADADSSDPVIDRLFPPAVKDDDLVDVEVRALIHDELLQGRLEALDALTEILDRATPHRGRHRVELVGDEPGLVLGVLNDLRLALGARVGIQDLDRDEIDEDHPAAWSIAVLDHFAWLQEQLIAELDPPSVFDADADDLDGLHE